MTLTNEPTIVEAAPSLYLKFESDHSSTVTFNTTASDDSDSYDEYDEAEECAHTDLDNNNNIVVNIVVDQGVKREAWSKPSFANVLRSNLETQQQTQTKQQPTYIRRKPKQTKKEEEGQQLDLDSISFVGHSYYNVKGHSYIARQQSLRLRPDEARRRDMINEKKDKQREGVSTKKEKKLRVVRRE